MHENKDIIIEAKDLPKMLEQLESGFYAIPVFQRDFVWEPKNILSLWDSIYRHYPIGSFLIWETEEKMPKHRKLFEIELKENEKGNFNYILDGQQRITSLLGSIKGAKRTATKTFIVYFNLKKALDERNKTHNEIEESPFLDETGFNDLSESDKLLTIPVSFLINFNTQFYRDLLLMGKNEQELAEFYREVCDRLKSKYKLSVIRLNKIPIEEVCEIFTRVNQKGKKLTLVELMTAKTYKQDEFYLIDTLKELNQGLDKEIDNYSDAIDETIFLRIISVINKKTCREKDLLTLSTETIKSLWKESAESYMKAIRYLKESLRVASPYLIPYPPMLVSLSYFFRKLGNKPLDDNTKKTLNSWFWINSFSGSYQGATNEKIHQDCDWFDRVLDGETKINAKFNKRIEIDDIIGQPINLNNAFCKAILCILSHSKPIDFTNHNAININEIFIKSKKDELHHFFPIKSEIGKQKRAELINSVANICFLPKDTNISITNKNPKDYLADARSKNKQFEEDIKTHLIPIQDALNNNFENFLKNRAIMILNNINVFIGLSSDIHKRLNDMPDELWNEYELEIRKLIDSELSKKHGSEYWNGNIIPDDINNTVSEKIKRETKLRPDLKAKFETSRAKIDNCDVMDYLKIVLKNWDIFEERFGSKEETQIQFKNLQVFRNSLKHIKTYSDSQELDELTKKKGELALLWLERILNIQEKNQEIKIDFTTLEELYSELTSEILKLGEGIKEEKKKYYTAFKKKGNIVCLQDQNSQIKLWFGNKKWVLNDPRKMAKDVSQTGHHGTGDYQVVFKSKDDLTYIVGLIKQAYDEEIKFPEEYDLNFHLEKIKDEKIKENVNTLRTKIKELDKSIMEHFSKYHISYFDGIDFCKLYVQKNNFWIDVKINKTQINSKSLDISNTKDEKWSHIRFNENTDLNEVLTLIKKAHEFKK